MLDSVDEELDSVDELDEVCDEVDELDSVELGEVLDVELLVFCATGGALSWHAVRPSVHAAAIATAKLR